MPNSIAAFWKAEIPMNGGSNHNESEAVQGLAKPTLVPEPNVCRGFLHSACPKLKNPRRSMGLAEHISIA